MKSTDKVFSGSVPALYESHLVPLIFQPYADDLATRLATLAPKHVLGVAAGTGVLTRALAKAVGPAVTIVATDLNQAMIDQARTTSSLPSVEWRRADAHRDGHLAQ